MCAARKADLGSTKENPLVSYRVWDEWTASGLHVFWGDNDPRATLKKREHFSDVDLTLPRLWMGGHTLEEREGVTYSVGLVRCQCGGVDRRVDVDDLLAKTKKKPHR